jgi:hypothetical protein
MSIAGVVAQIPFKIVGGAPLAVFPLTAFEITEEAFSIL